MVAAPDCLKSRGIRRDVPISATIIALNEAERIGAAIESVAGLVDEVIVVDCGSTDDTVAVARALGARVVHNAWAGYGPQKRFAEDLCAHDWVLNIDADERLTAAVADGIRAALACSGANDGYYLDIVERYPFESCPRRSARRVRALRLYRRSLMRYRDHPLHDRVVAPDGARLGRIGGAIVHDSHLSVADTVSKQNRLTTEQAEDLIASGRAISPLRLIFETPVAFFKALILRQYIRYGLWGLVMARLYAHQRFLRLAKAYEAQRMAASRGGPQQ